MSSSKDIKEQVLPFCATFCLSVLAPILVVSVWPVPSAINLGWDWANLLGYLCLAICGFLFIYRSRARTFPAFSSRFFANLHRELGFIALGLLLAHVGILLLVEPLLLEYLNPTAPFHMLAGLMAFILMIMLATLSIPPIRRRMLSNYHVFRHLHAVLAVSVFILIAVHILGSGFYLNAGWKIGLLSAAGIGLLIYYSLDRKAPDRSMPRLNHSSGYSSYVSYGCTTLTVLVCLTLALVKQFL